MSKLQTRLARNAKQNGTVQVVENRDRRNHELSMGINWSILWLYLSQIDQKVSFSDGSSVREYDFYSLGVSAEDLRMKPEVERWLEANGIAKFSRERRFSANSFTMGSKKLVGLDANAVIEMYQRIQKMAEVDDEVADQIQYAYLHFMKIYNKIKQDKRTCASSTEEIQTPFDEYIKERRENRQAPDWAW